jgi:hypothetical protein
MRKILFSLHEAADRLFFDHTTVTPDLIDLIIRNYDDYTPQRGDRIYVAMTDELYSSDLWYRHGQDFFRLRNMDVRLVPWNDYAREEFKQGDSARNDTTTDS